MSKSRNELIVPFSEPDLYGIWTKFFTNMTEAIQLINCCINNTPPFKRHEALERIVNIVTVQIALASPGWRTHVEGYLTLIQVCGGVDEVWKASLSAPGKITWMLM